MAMLLLIVGVMVMNLANISAEIYNRDEVEKKMIPFVSFADVMTLDKSSMSQALITMMNVGAVQIVDLPKFDAIKEQGFSSIISCIDDDVKSSSFINVEVVKGCVTKESSHCTEGGNHLRATVDAISRQFVLSLDIAISDVTASRRENPSANLFLPLSYTDSFRVPQQSEKRITLALSTEVSDSSYFYALVGTDNLILTVCAPNGGLACDDSMPVLEGRSDALIIVPTMQGLKWLRSYLGIPDHKPTQVVSQVYIASSPSAAMLSRSITSVSSSGPQTASITATKRKLASDSNQFCTGSGQSMNMAGFYTMSKDNAVCLNLFFKSWTLDSSGKFAGGCIFTFVLGLLIQLLSRIRAELNSKRMRLLNGDRKTALIILCYGLQTTLGYFAMLATMTYSGEIFAMIILGLTLGHGLFNMHLPAPVSTDPCCDAENEMLGEKLSAPDHSQ